MVVFAYGGARILWSTARCVKNFRGIIRDRTSISTASNVSKMGILQGAYLVDLFCSHATKYLGRVGLGSGPRMVSCDASKARSLGNRSYRNASYGGPCPILCFWMAQRSIRYCHGRQSYKHWHCGIRLDRLLNKISTSSGNICVAISPAARRRARREIGVILYS